MARAWLVACLLFVRIALGAAVAHAADLSGRYAITGKSDDGAGYAGELAIAHRGSAFDVSWQRGGTASESGLGLTLKHVLGVAYWPGHEVKEQGLGTVIYQIDRGTLDGIWLPEGAYNQTPGREVLAGSPDLTGRFQITLGVNPGGHSTYSGYADLERSGDHFRIIWHAPTVVFRGTGIKIGNVLAVAYAYQHYPAVAAYCANGQNLQGFWWTGPNGRAGRETLSPLAGREDALPSPEAANPRDPCTTPLAANF